MVRGAILIFLSLSLLAASQTTTPTAQTASAPAQTTTVPPETTPPAQAAAEAPAQAAANPAAQAAPSAQRSLKQLTVPAGTEVLLQLKNGIDTKNARVGDGVYCQTTFPVIVDNVIAIPSGTYVKGEIVQMQRAGKVTGRAQVQFRFTSMIYPNGYMVDMPGTIHHDSGAANTTVDDEGKITADSQKGKDAGTVGKGVGIGAAGGGILTGTHAGVLRGAGIGALAGLATVLLTRGQDVRIEPGTAFKMLLDRPLTVDVTPIDFDRAATEVVPRQTGGRLPRPQPPSNPK
jgi:type IV secretion system protein VirB10